MNFETLKKINDRKRSSKERRPEPTEQSIDKRANALRSRHEMAASQLYQLRGLLGQINVSTLELGRDKNDTRYYADFTESYEVKMMSANASDKKPQKLHSFIFTYGFSMEHVPTEIDFTEPEVTWVNAGSLIVHDSLLDSAENEVKDYEETLDMLYRAAADPVLNPVIARHFGGRSEQEHTL